MSSSCEISLYDYSVSRTPLTTISQANPTGNCFVTSLPLVYGQAHANMSATLYLPVPGSPSTPVGGELDGDIGVFLGLEGPQGNFLGWQSNNVGMAQLSMSLDLSLSTPGPVRSGWIQLHFCRDFTTG